LPLEAGPTSRTACGTDPATMVAIAASAPGWPRVVAFSIGSGFETTT
jgi:hypothetical protein